MKINQRQRYQEQRRCPARGSAPDARNRAWLQVLVQETLGGEPHLAFLGSLAMGLDERRFGVVRGGGSEQRVGHAQAGVQDIDDGLPLVGVVLGDSLERVALYRRYTGSLTRLLLDLAFPSVQ
ncbi:hypothetical protein OHS18_41260 [Amycolatopsis sp. NBC_00355]